MSMPWCHQRALTVQMNLRKRNICTHSLTGDELWGEELQWDNLLRVTEVPIALTTTPDSPSRSKCCLYLQSEGDTCIHTTDIRNQLFWITFFFNTDRRKASYPKTAVPPISRTFRPIFLWSSPAKQHSSMNAFASVISVRIPLDSSGTCTGMNVAGGRTRKLGEEDLSRFVWCSLGPNLINPLILWIIIDHKFFNKAVYRLDSVSVRNSRSCKNSGICSCCSPPRFGWRTFSLLFNKWILHSLFCSRLESQCFKAQQNLWPSFRNECQLMPEQRAASEPVIIERFTYCRRSEHRTRIAETCWNRRRGRLSRWRSVLPGFRASCRRSETSHWSWCRDHASAAGSGRCTLSRWSHANCTCHGPGLYKHGSTVAEKLRITTKVKRIAQHVRPWFLFPTKCFGETWWEGTLGQRAT